MKRLFRQEFWRRNLSRLRSPAGRSEAAFRFVMMFWPRILRPATVYRRTLTRRTRVVCVVGSLGKTTTTRAVAVALGIPERRITERNEATFVALAILRIRPWQRRAVVEVGIDGPGQMARYRDLVRPDVVVVTSIASDHARSFRSLEATRAEKSEMLRNLGPDGLAVLNGDDPNVLWMRGVTRARVVTFGFGDACDYRATEVVADWPNGTRFQVHVRGETQEVRTGLIGRTYVYAALAALAVAMEDGVALVRAIRGLSSLRPTPRRLSPMPLPSGAIVLRDDFKSSIESIDVALDALFDIPARRRIVVLGSATDLPSGGKELLRRIGERVGRGADHAVFFGDSDRTYATGAKRAGMPAAAIRKVGNNLAAAVEALPGNLGPGDVILVKGRGSQRLARIALMLSGRRVGCRIVVCPMFEWVSCDTCGLLERGWVRAGIPAAGGAAESVEEDES
ncbi:MAG: hypothetical protein JNL10_21075 [Verrucomicrobiales bacterium]|nr:hypothetical protein [Verrucomicrobiales bacterium]